MAWLKNHYKRILIALFSSIALLYALPFITYLLLPGTRQFMQAQLQYKPLLDSLTAKTETDSAKAMSLFNYVATTCKQPVAGQNPKYEYPHQVLQHKTASCDQQVWLLMDLLRVENIDAQMVFLYGYDSISHHTVTAVSIERGSYVMFDPFYNLYVVNGRNKLASIGDIVKGDIQYFNHAVELNYLDLYETKYPYKIHSDNTLSTTKKIVRTLLYTDYYIFGNAFSKPFIALQQ